MENLKIILGSTSPRRKELLSMIFDNFEIMSPNIDETVGENIEPKVTAEYLALKKADAISEKDALIITADTVVLCDNKILGKPSDKDDAITILKNLSKKTHTVISGVCLKYNDSILSFSETTKVEFLKVSDSEIIEYVNTDEPYDKAGGYGIQGKAALFIKGIKGDYYNVVGLPISRLNKEIKLFRKTAGF